MERHRGSPLDPDRSSGDDRRGRPTGRDRRDLGTTSFEVIVYLGCIVAMFVTALVLFVL